MVGLNTWPDLDLGLVIDPHSYTILRQDPYLDHHVTRHLDLDPHVGIAIHPRRDSAFDLYLNIDSGIGLGADRNLYVGMGLDVYGYRITDIGRHLDADLGLGLDLHLNRDADEYAHVDV